MHDLTILPRTLRRILADWLTRLVERLLHLQDQLRFGLIRMISSSVAETIEDQLHRPFGTPPDQFEEEYLDYEPSSTPRLAYSEENQTTRPSHPRESWQTIVSRAANTFRQWLQKPWVETVVAGSVTLVSLFLLVG